MAKRNSIVGVALASLVVLVSASASFGQVQTTDQKNCLNRLNKAGVNLARQQGKENVACLKLAGKGDLVGTAQACLTADVKGRMLKKQNKTIAEETKYCTTVPNFGYTNAATVNQFAAQAELDLLADVFGADLDAAVISCDANKKACTCQQKITRAVDKVAAKKMSEFLKCKKATLKAGATSIAAIEDCVDDAGTVGSIADDAKGGIAKAVVSLNTRITKDCDEDGVTLGSFPGDCDTLTGAALGTCLDILVECRVCQMINDMDAAFVNCDLFDDGNPNASCASGAGPTPTITMTPTQTPTPTHTPTVDPAQTFRGALAKTSGTFNYGGTHGVPGANNECNIRFPGSHACTISELLDAESAGELVGATDHNSLTVTSFWVIDALRPDDEQCYDLNGSELRWDYNTAHTGHFGTRATLNNGSGDLGAPIAPVSCGTPDWVGCCQ